MNKYQLTSLICIIVLLLDQITKYFVTVYIPLYSSIDILPVLDFTHIRNTGVAFGMLQGLPSNLKLPFFIVVFVVAVVVVISIIRNTDSNNKTMIIGLALILAGAIGNSLDRFRLGYVTDFIDFHWFNNPSLHWPPFNISDSAITIGAILIVITGFFFNRAKD